MTDNVIDITPTPVEATPSHYRRNFFILLGILVFLGLAAAASIVFSETDAFAFGPGSWRHGFMDGPLDPAEIEDHAERAIKHLVIEIDATPDQQAKLEAVVKSALKDLLPMRDQLRAGRQKARELLTGSSIDRTEIEKLRAEQMALIDNASKRIAQALGDAADILTPAQRQQIAEEFPPGGFWHRWHRG
jgi:periplasmic protein CpxP/Spy